jgi:hypothetical protein
MRAALAVVFVLGAIGCGGSDECSSDEVEVAYLGGARDGETVCAPIPTACGAAADCTAQACIAAMYGLCESPYLGVACSDSFPPVIISCND